jgi:hypothetical protein
LRGEEPVDLPADASLDEIVTSLERTGRELLELGDERSR